MQQAEGHRAQAGQAARFTFRGRFDCASFAEFALHRAARLDLEIKVDDLDTAAATLSVRGQESLVDMFEMACSLGPYDCLVLDVERRAIDWTYTEGLPRQSQLGPMENSRRSAG